MSASQLAKSGAKMKKYLLAGAALAVIATPAAARDNSAYFGIEAGLMFPMNSDIEVDDVVLLDNGAIQMKVLSKDGNKVECEVLTEGTLGSRRHINLPGVKVSLPALTAKDLADVEVGLQLGVDYIALSFVREAKDIQQLKKCIILV